MATLVAGREVLKEGFEDLLHFHFGEETLMSIAVVAAFLIGEYVEGTMGALLFTFGENLFGNQIFLFYVTTIVDYLYGLCYFFCYC